MRFHWADRLDPWKIHTAGVGALAALTLSGYFLGLGPCLARRAEAHSLQTSIGQEQRMVSKLEQRERVIQAELNATRRELSARALRLQTAAYRNERLALLTELAAANRLTVDGMHTTDVVQDERYDMVPIQIEGSGEFPDCAGFLHQLNERFLDTGIESFELRGDPGSSSADAFFRYEMIWYAAPSLAAADDDRGR